MMDMILNIIIMLVKKYFDGMNNFYGPVLRAGVNPFI